MYLKKLLGLLLRCILFGLAGGALFTVLSGTQLGLLPYLIAMGAGAGWPFTRPLGIIGKNDLIISALLLTLRMGTALVLGWIILLPYCGYLVVQTVRG